MHCPYYVIVGLFSNTLANHDLSHLIHVHMKTTVEFSGVKGEGSLVYDALHAHVC